MASDYSKYKLYRKYKTEDGVNYTPLDEYQAVYESGDGVDCSCGYREYKYIETDGYVCGKEPLIQTFNYTENKNKYFEFWYSDEYGDNLELYPRVQLIECVVPKGYYDRDIYLSFGFNTLGYKLILTTSGETVVSDKIVYTVFDEEYNDELFGYDNFDLFISSGQCEVNNLVVKVSNPLKWTALKEVGYCPTEEGYDKETGVLKQGTYIGRSWDCGYHYYESVKSDPVEYVYGYDVGLDPLMKYEKNSVWMYDPYNPEVREKTEYFWYENPVEGASYQYFDDGVLSGEEVIDELMLGTTLETIFKYGYRPYHSYKMQQKYLVKDNGEQIPLKVYQFSVDEAYKYEEDYTFVVKGSGKDTRYTGRLDINKCNGNNGQSTHSYPVTLDVETSILVGVNKWEYPIKDICNCLSTQYAGNGSNVQYRCNYIKLANLKNVESFSGAFYNAIYLRTIDASNAHINLDIITDTDGMLNGCSSLKTLILGDVTQEVYDWWYQRLVDASIQNNVTIEATIV